MDTQNTTDFGKIYATDERKLVLYKSAIDYFNNVQRVTIYINGGATAIIAGLAAPLIGSGIQAWALTFVAASVLLFSAGLLLSAVSNFYSYKAQMSYFYIMTGERDPSIDPDRHVSYYNSAILFVGLSLLSFIGGALLCASALFFHEGGAVALEN